MLPICMHVLRKYIWRAAWCLPVLHATYRMLRATYRVSGCPLHVACCRSPMGSTRRSLGTLRARSPACACWPRSVGGTWSWRCERPSPPPLAAAAPRRSLPPPRRRRPSPVRPPLQRCLSLGSGLVGPASAVACRTLRVAYGAVQTSMLQRGRRSLTQAHATLAAHAGTCTASSSTRSLCKCAAEAAGRAPYLAPASSSRGSCSYLRWRGGRRVSPASTAGR